MASTILSTTNPSTNISALSSLPQQLSSPNPNGHCQSIQPKKHSTPLPTTLRQKQRPCVSTLRGNTFRQVLLVHFPLTWVFIIIPLILVLQVIHFLNYPSSHDQFNLL